jgi:hypothetical protein
MKDKSLEALLEVGMWLDDDKDYQSFIEEPKTMDVLVDGKRDRRTFTVDMNKEFGYRLIPDIKENETCHFVLGSYVPIIISR